MQEETKIIHSVPIDELTGAISVPIYQTSTFEQELPGVNKGFDYSRTNNPTRKVLEQLVADMEGGRAGFAFASGLAAIDAVLKLLESGDEVIAVEDIYGGTYRTFEHVYRKFGIKVNYVDTTDPCNVLNAVTKKTKLIWLESPTNPTLKVSDIKAISRIAEVVGAVLVVDNTFASPVIQKPLSLGADIVVHSATKYLAGHCDVLAGLVVVKSQALAEQVKFYQNAGGSVLGPFDSWLTIRGIETLSLRLEKQSQNALEIAEFLQSSDLVDKVYYPGLVSHQNHHIARKQQKLFGGVVSFSLKTDTVKVALDVISETKLFKLAESLGGIKSLICHPASMTHKGTPSEVKQKAGVQDSLIRLSVGIEHASDLIADLEQALDKVKQQKKIAAESWQALSKK